MYHLVHATHGGTAPGPRAPLAAVVDHLAAEGLSDQSLRRIAEAVGTSHRMLLYHFGSRDGLLLAVAREVEARTPGQLGRCRVAGTGSTDDVVRRMWAHVADPAFGDLERLFFALYARALQGDPAARPLLEGDIESWVEANVALTGQAGIPEPVARAHARLGVAVVRGLLLDLLATGDRAGVDEALEAFARRYAGRWWDDQRPAGGPGAAGTPARSASTAGA